VRQRHFVVAASGTVKDADSSHDQEVEPSRAETLLAGGSFEVAAAGEWQSMENPLILAVKGLAGANTRL